MNNQDVGAMMSWVDEIPFPANSPTREINQYKISEYIGLYFVFWPVLLATVGDGVGLLT